MFLLACYKEVELVAGGSEGLRIMILILISRTEQAPGSEFNHIDKSDKIVLVFWDLLGAIKRQTDRQTDKHTDGHFHVAPHKKKYARSEVYFPYSVV